MVRLDAMKYACGLEYFEKGGRIVPSASISNNKTWVVHNNWIVGYAAKVYRFKEHLMWVYDKGTCGVALCHRDCVRA